MKKLILFLCLLASSAFAADTVRFTEHLIDTATSTGIRTTDSVTLNVSLTVPELQGINLSNAVINFKLGSLQLDQPGAEADIRTANSYTIYQKEGGHRVNNGFYTVTLIGTHLTITASSSNLHSDNPDQDSFIISESELLGGPTNETKIGVVTYELKLGDTVAKSGSVAYKAIKRVTLSGLHLLRNYTINGEVDVAKPTLVITSPHAAQRVLTDTITVSGRATDNFGVQSVQLFVNNQPAGTAILQSNGTWSREVTLQPGENTIAVEAADLLENESTRTIVKVNKIVSAPLHLTVDQGGTVRGGTNTQSFEVSKRTTLVATADPGYTFVGWSGDVTANTPALSFTMPANGISVHAIFRPKDFTGIFTPDSADTVAGTNSGYFTLTRNVNGTVSGKLILNGQTIPFSGKHLSETNSADFTITRPGKTTLHVQFTINDKTVTGSVDDGNFVSRLNAFSAASSTEAFTGRYTAYIHATGQPPVTAPTNTIPQGHGTLTINVTKSSALFSGALPEGTTFSASGPLLVEVDDPGNRVRVPLYASIQGGRQTVVGWVLFVRQQHEGAPDTFTVDSENAFWVKNPSTTDKTYKAGFSTPILIGGSKYTMPSGNNNALGYSNAVLHLSSGNLAATIFKPATVTKTKVTVSDDTATTEFPTAASLNTHININPALGTVTGDFKHPVTHAVTRLNGVVIQGTNPSIIGFFIGTDESGQFNVFSAAPSQ